MSQNETSTAAVADTNGKKVRGPKTPIDNIKGLKVGDIIDAGSAAFVEIRMVAHPTRSSEKVASFAKVSCPCPEGGSATLLLPAGAAPRGTRGGRGDYWNGKSVVSRTPRLEVVETFERDGRKEGILSALKPVEDEILREFNQVDEATGERVRVFVDAKVVHVKDDGLRCLIEGGIADSFSVFLHKSKIPGGVATLKKFEESTDDHVLEIEVLKARRPDKSKKSEADRDDLVLEVSLRATEDQKAADEKLRTELTGNAGGRLTGVVTGGTETDVIISVDQLEGVTFNAPQNKKRPMREGDKVHVTAYIVPGDRPDGEPPLRYEVGSIIS